MADIFNVSSNDFTNVNPLARIPLIESTFKNSYSLDNAVPLNATIESKYKTTNVNGVNFLHVFSPCVFADVADVLNPITYLGTITKLNDKKNVNCNDINDTIFERITDAEYDALKISSSGYALVDIECGIGLKASLEEPKTKQETITVGTSSYEAITITNVDQDFLFKRMQGCLLLDAQNRLDDGETDVGNIKTAINDARVCMLEFKIPLINEIIGSYVSSRLAQYAKYMRQTSEKLYFIQYKTTPIINLLYNCVKYHLVLAPEAVIYKWNNGKFEQEDIQPVVKLMQSKPAEPDKRLTFGTKPLSGGSDFQHKRNKYIQKIKQLEILINSYQ